MLMNSGVSGKFGNVINFSQKELLNTIKNASIHDEIPLTYVDNYLLTWGEENQSKKNNNMVLKLS